MERYLSRDQEQFVLHSRMKKLRLQRSCLELTQKRLVATPGLELRLFGFQFRNLITCLGIEPRVTAGPNWHLYLKDVLGDKIVGTKE